MFRNEGSKEDYLGRLQTSFSDQDMDIQYITEEWYGRKLKTLELSSREMEKQFAASQKARNKVRAFFVCRLG